MKAMHKKSHKKYFKNPTIIQSHLKYGTYGFKVLSQIYLESNYLIFINSFIEKELKKINTNYLKWNLISPNINLTKLSPESRMGKGKGNIRLKGKFIRSGSIIYEFENIHYFQVEKILNRTKKIIKGTNISLVTRKNIKCI